MNGHRVLAPPSWDVTEVARGKRRLGFCFPFPLSFVMAEGETSRYSNPDAALEAGPHSHQLAEPLTSGLALS